MTILALSSADQRAKLPCNIITVSFTSVGTWPVTEVITKYPNLFGHHAGLEFSHARHCIQFPPLSRADL